MSITVSISLSFSVSPSLRRSLCYPLVITPAWRVCVINVAVPLCLIPVSFSLSCEASYAAAGLGQDTAHYGWGTVRDLCLSHRLYLSVAPFFCLSLSLTWFLLQLNKFFLQYLFGISCIFTLFFLIQRVVCATTQARESAVKIQELLKR